MLKRLNIRDEFDEKYPVWATSIIRYCKDTQIKSSSLQSETKDTKDMNDGTLVTCVEHVELDLSIIPLDVIYGKQCKLIMGITLSCALSPSSRLSLGSLSLTESVALVALRCLALLFIPTKTKKIGENIPFILQVVPVSVIIDPTNSGRSMHFPSHLSCHNYFPTLVKM